MLMSFFPANAVPGIRSQGGLCGAVANGASGADKRLASALVLALGVLDAAADNDMIRGETTRGLK